MIPKLQYLTRTCTMCAMLLLLGACDKNSVYQHIITLPDATWPVSLLPEFQFTIQDETQHYDIYLLVESTPDYPFQNLHVTYCLRDEAAEVLQHSLQDFALFDAKTGQPRGQRCAFALLKDYEFSQPGTYHLRLEQFMRTEVLAGVAAVGIRVVRSSPSL